MTVIEPALDRKRQESTGKHWQEGVSQRPLPLLAAVAPPQLAPPEFITRAGPVGALRIASHASGLDDYEIAQTLALSPGAMSKVLKGTASLSLVRLVRFMQLTRCLAPLQWLAEQLGCDVVQRDTRAAEVAALRERLRDLERVA